MTLWAEFLGHQGRIAHKWTQFFPAYERHFGRFVNQPVRMLEIGAGKGGSAQLWKSYLGPSAEIVSIDIEPEAKEFEERQVTVEIGDQGDPEFLAGVVERHGPFDVILDDGSHEMGHMTASFRALYPTMTPTGVYAVEDLHTCYHPAYGGGLRKEDTFLELVKGLIDELNAEHSYTVVETTDFTRTTTSMHFYPSIVFFELGRSTGLHTDLMMGGEEIDPTPS